MEEESYNSPLENWWPETLDLNHSELAGLSSRAAVEIDNHLRGRGSDQRPPKESDFSPIRRFGKIIYLAFMEENPNLLSNFYERQIFSRAIEKPLDTNLEDYQKIGLELIKLRDLSKERQEELRGTCVSLSRQFSAHWSSKHPYGFKHYAA